MLSSDLWAPAHYNNANILYTHTTRAGSEKMKPFCDVILHFRFQPVTPPMSKVEEWHSYISKVLTFLNVSIYTFPCLLWIALEI